MPNISSLSIANLIGFAFILFTIIGCEPSQKKSDSKNEPTEIAIENTKPESETIPVTEREYPMLDTSNVERFLEKYLKENPERRVMVVTRLGTLKVELFDDTPLHTANFLMMTKRNYFTGTEFIRVVPEFVVQGGNNDSDIEEVKRMLIGSYTLPSEFREDRIHRRGALSMARSYTKNPDMRSSPYNFFFVHGRKFNEPQLLSIERDEEMVIPEWKREVYRTIGGAPHLDNRHTVFGRIYEGMDVLDKMAAVETDKGDWPVEPLIMEINVIDE